MWLSNIHCQEGSKFNHILKCKYDYNPVSTQEYDHYDDIYLDCRKTNTLCIRVTSSNVYVGEVGTARPDDIAVTAYRGQVALVPPKTQVELNISRSYGVAIIRQGAGGEHWEYIKKESYLDQAVADTLCMQMGFTHAVVNSVMNVSLSAHIYDYGYYLGFV